MNSEKLFMYALPILILAVILLASPQLSERNINRAFALSAAAVLGITFILGPIGKFSKRLNRLKIYRKYLGLFGFLFVVIHGLLSIAFYYGYDISFMVSLDNPRYLQFYSAFVAFLIFISMAATSSVRAIKLLGAKRWKLLQNTGYLAMALVMLHFLLANTNAEFQIGRLYALAVFVFGLLVLLVRLFVLALVAYEKSNKSR
jgi:DMSO/TMAO reductase YedYZ heme-binding membrane subunit